MAKAINGHNSALVQAFKARQAAERGTPPDDPDFAGKCPNLFEVLTRVLLDKGHSVHRAGRVEFENCGGQWLWKIHYPPIGGWKEVLVARIEDGPGALEAILADPRYPWRFYAKLKEVRIREKDPKKKDKLDELDI